MKKIYSICIIAIIGAVMLVGCGESKNNPVKSDNKVSSSEKKEKIKMNQLPYEINSEIMNDNRYVVMKLTNNTDYTIVSFEMKFKEKSDITKEQKDKFCKEVKEEVFNQMTDEDFEKIKSEPISMHTQIEKVIKSGAVEEKIHCYYYQGIYYLKNMDHFKLVEPDMVTIKYIDDGKIYKMYYDYVNDSYSFDNETEDAVQWSTNLGKKIPKANSEYIESTIDSDSNFMCDVYGISKEDYQKYIEECKKMGYTKDSDSFDDFYSAENSEGYELSLDYDADKCKMDISISCPDE